MKKSIKSNKLFKTSNILKKLMHLMFPPFSSIKTAHLWNNLTKMARSKHVMLMETVLMVWVCHNIASMVMRNKKYKHRTQWPQQKARLWQSVESQLTFTMEL